MAAQTNAAPVIIKRKKVVIVGGGHHGGAWKVAYADFVTAMMAFFLLMWLLNATTEKQRKGISDYFNPTIPVNRISGGGRWCLSGVTASLPRRPLPIPGPVRWTAGLGAAPPADTEDDGNQPWQCKRGMRAVRAIWKRSKRPCLARGGESATMERLSAAMS